MGLAAVSFNSMGKKGDSDYGKKLMEIAALL
jgi:hypothetical protein